MDNIINGLRQVYKNGISNNVVKEEIVASLNPYFVNREVLEHNFQSSSLLSVYEFLIKYSQDEKFSNGLIEVLACYRNAFQVNSYETICILLEKADDFVESENKMWSVRNSRPEFEKELYDNVMQSFQYVGNGLEISVKGIISELYALCCIINRKSVNYQEICSNNLGYNINQLLKEGHFESILKVKPHNLKLSDWRNVAMHYSYFVENNMIVLTYGKDNKNVIKMNFDEFKDCIYQIMRSSNILNIARCIFVYDNMSSISKHNKKELLSNKFRDEMLFNQLKISLLSEGYEVKSIFRDKSRLEVELQDLIGEISNSKDIIRREKNIAQIFGNRANGLSADRIDVKYYSNEGLILDVFWLSISIKNNN